MKIGLIRRGFSSSGGAEAYLLRLASGLMEEGHEPVLITSGDWPEDRWPGGDIIRVPGQRPLAFAANFRRDTFPVDVTFTLERVPGCDVFRAGDGVHSAWLKRRSQFEPTWKRWLRSLNPKHLALMGLERELLQSVRGVIANSEMVANEITHWHDYPRERIHIIYNGIGSAIPLIDREKARYRLNLTDDTFCVLFVGTGWERKGLAHAIAAVEKLGPNALLLVAGRGPDAAYASRQVKFFGPLRDLSTVFSAADVFTLPTIYDPFSNACLEALGAGLPVVTTSANGFSEIIQRGVHGNVVEPGDVDGLTNALASWRKKPSPREKCQALAAKYTIQRNVSETVKVLEAVLREKED